jgi:hypothetical protein
MTVTSQPPAPAEAPQTEPVRPRRRPTAGIAGAALALLALSILVAGVALGSLRPASQGALARYAGADTTAFVEARLDLPGDQRQQLVEFMRHFPGFSDEADVDRLVGQLFDEMAAKADEGVTWERDVEPWFGGQVAAFGTVRTDGNNSAEEALEDADALVAMSVRDRAAANEFLSGRAANHDWTSQEYRGATVWQGAVRRDQEIVIALSQDAVLAGERIGTVRAALDVAAGELPSLDAQPAYADAVTRLHADRLATIYLDAAALSELQAEDGLVAAGTGMSSFGTFGGTVVAELRAEGDHMALTARLRPAAGDPPLPGSRSTGLAGRMPADSLVYMEMREVGASLERMLEPFLEQLAEEDPEGALDEQLEVFLGTPPAEFLDFLEDVAISASSSRGEYSGGLIATVTDEELARERMQRLVGVLRTAAQLASVPLTVSEEEHAGATVTVIRLSAEAEAAMDADIPPVSFAFSDGLLLLGVDDFVRDALDRGDQGGLAANADYASALAAAGGDENAGVVFVDLVALRDLADEYAGDRGGRRYERIRPYLTAFDRLISVTVRDGEELVSRTLLYVE